MTILEQKLEHLKLAIAICLSEMDVDGYQKTRKNIEKIIDEFRKDYEEE